MLNMSFIEIIMCLITGLLFFSVIVCGLWIQFTGEEIEPSSVMFHMILGFLSIIAASITMFILLSR